MEIYALYGKSGTGKSHRASEVIARYGIDALIDDGILIVNKVRVAGKSAKNESTALAATRRAVLDSDDHRTEISEYIERSRFDKILIIGTSKKMIQRIICRLHLEQVDVRWIAIESLQSNDDLELAARERRRGHHVIPIYPLEIRSTYHRPWYRRLVLFFSKHHEEVTVVRPAYARPEIAGGTVVVDVQCIKDIIIHVCPEGWRTNKIKVEQHVQWNVINLSLTVPFPCTIRDIHEWRSEVTKIVEYSLGTPYLIHVLWETILLSDEIPPRRGTYALRWRRGGQS